MKYRLGLDLGANSLGWALVELQAGVPWYDAEPINVVASGVRMFDAGVEGSIEQGRDSSRAAERRKSRQSRRQNWRRQYRKSALFSLLQRLNHLPATTSREADLRDITLKSLDDSLRLKWCKEGDVDSYQKLPYLLRASALDQLLEPYELGRALYHLGQRRGYKPNRKADLRDDDELGKVASGISTLDRARLADSDDPNSLRTFAQTVRDEFGQQGGRFVLKSEDPASATRGRIRKRFTSRKMYHDEFIAIRDAQLRFGTSIQPFDWKKLEKALFHQRPLKSQKHLVGRCTIEFDKRGRGLRRCTIALLDFQEFRLLQAVNHLRFCRPGQPPETLSDLQRKMLVDYLQLNGDLLLEPPKRRAKSSATPSVLSLLQLPKGTSFSIHPFQDGGDADDDSDDNSEMKIIGNRTVAKLRPIFGERWAQLSDVEKEQLVLQILYIDSPDSLKNLATRKWQLSLEAAETLSRLKLEVGFGGLSRKAIRKLLPELRNGASYAEARKKVYPDSFKACAPSSALPPLYQWNGDVRNPAVTRALTEVRKVVNAIVREYGKPEQIHVELARDLKRSRSERKEIWQKNEELRRLRERAARGILSEIGVARADAYFSWEFPVLLRDTLGSSLPYGVSWQYFPYR